MDIQTNFDKVAARFEAPDDFKKMMMGNPNKKGKFIASYSRANRNISEIPCI